MIDRIKRILLLSAEIFDAWRIVPRIMVVLYGYLIYKLYTWFRSIETVEKIECNESLMSMLLDEGIDLEQASVIACTVIDIIGGPTMEQSTFVTVVIGLASA